MTRTKLWTIFTVLSSSLLLLLSCSQQEENLFLPTDDLSLTCVQSTWTGTRATMDNEGQGSFSEGDRIEVRIAGGNKTAITPLEYTTGQWTPRLQRHEYGTGPLTLSALFPLQTQHEENLQQRDIHIPVDQSSEGNYSAADILFARTSIGITDASATLKFNHALHRININLKGNIPEDLVIEVKSLAGGQISLENGAVTTDASDGYVWIKPFRKSDYVYSLIILPQDTKAFTSGEGLVRLTTGGKSASYTFNGNAETFNPGMQTTLNLTLKTEESNVDLEFSNQTYWVYGITVPTFPGKEELFYARPGIKEFEDGLWFRYANETMSPPLLLEEEYLTWKEDFGWFDCNKTFNYDGDGNMCWAAAASNLIHWWMAQNRKYIEAYDKEYGPEYKGIDRPEKYSKMTETNQQHSEVFNLFKSCFNNQGSWDTGGVNWYVNGNKQKLTYCKWQDFHGFFSKVFSKDDAVAKETYDTSKETFNQWIKDAFRYNQAIGFAAYDFAGRDTKSHSMVIWGAEFDAEGNVAFVYICDNNNSADEPNHASLKRYKVVYDKSTIPELKGDYAYISLLDNIDGTPSTTRFRFTSITLVDLRRDLWQKAFPDVK